MNQLSMFAPIVEVMTATVAYMKITLVPGTSITFYQLWCGGLICTGLIDVLGSFVPRAGEDEDIWYGNVRFRQRWKERNGKPK